MIRADGSTELGHGHVFRTLALADELRRRGFAVPYLCRELEGAPLQRIEDAGHELVRLDPTLPEEQETRYVLEATRERGANWVVIDRYASVPEFYRALRSAGLRVLAIDDVCGHPFPVDLLLNQNVNAGGLRYECDPETVRLLGPKYALLSRAYSEARSRQPPTVDPVGRLLIFMGGGDPSDVTGRVLRALENCTERRLELNIVVGSGYRYREPLERHAEASPHHVTLARDLHDLVHEMRGADAFIGAGGSTVWEACCMGLPMALIPFAENLVAVAQELESLGAAQVLGRSSPASDQTLAAELAAWLDGRGQGLNRQAEIAWGLVDGLGAARIVDLMGQLGPERSTGQEPQVD